jgi:hypothetical protein
MAALRHPPHPGVVLRDGDFSDTVLAVTGCMTHLSVTRVARAG